MSVTIERGVLSHIRRQGSSFAIQAGSPSDVSHATEALRRAATAIAALDGGSLRDIGLPQTPRWISDVVVVPDGPMLMIDGGFTPARLLATVPEIVAGELAGAGVSAVIRVPRQAWNTTDFEAMPGAVALRVFATPSHLPDRQVDVPTGWRAATSRWLTTDCERLSELMCGLQGVNFVASLDEASELLKQWEHDRPGDVIVATGSMTHLVRSATMRLSPTGNINLALAVGGPAATDDDLLAHVSELQDIARSLACDASYTFISLEHTMITDPAPEPAWAREMDGAHSVLARELCDEIVFDAFPYQVLGPGHLKRLGSDPSGSVRLSDTHVELQLGTTPSWLLRDRDDPLAPKSAHDRVRRDPDVQGHARTALQPCLLTVQHAQELWRERVHAAQREHEG